MIVIDAASPTPPYEQLRAQLARQIQDCSLAVGTRLPTIRRLAADLSLAVNTVGRAYRELEEAGLIETRDRAVGDQPASADDDDMVGGHRHLAHQVRGHQDRAALRREAPQ
jgi:DNA-binding transcriptional regulator YhcF (GntR family)